MSDRTRTTSHSQDTRIGTLRGLLLGLGLIALGEQALQRPPRLAGREVGQVVVVRRQVYQPLALSIISQWPVRTGKAATRSLRRLTRSY